MKKISLLLLVVFVLYNCTSNSPENDVDMIDPNNTLVINSFRPSIVSPEQTRDFSYYNQGFNGIFEDPDASKAFSGQIDITYGSNSPQLNPSDINVTWSSSLDGVLFQGNPDGNFESEISSNLSKGVHKIYFEASVANLDLTVKDSVVLSNALKLTAESTGKSVLLNWTPYEGNDFVSYKVLTENFSPIAEITDINTTEFEDSNHPSVITDEKAYQVIVETSQTYEHPIGSPIVNEKPGIFIEFPYFVHKVIKDPMRSKLYALVGNKGADADAYGILVLTFNNETLEIDDHILQQSLYADADISPDGQYLFMVEEDAEVLTRLNLNTLQSVTFPTDTNTWGLHKIEVGNNNVLYCHRDPPTSGTSPFYIYDGNTGNLINGPHFLQRHGDIELNSATNIMYGSQSNTSNGKMFKYTVNGTSISTVAEFPTGLNGVSFPRPFLLLSPDSQSLFWDEYQLDLDLNLMRNLGTEIKACSPSNQYLADSERIYNYSDLSVACEFPDFPVGIFVSNVQVFADDDHLIYLHVDQDNTIPPGAQYLPAKTYFFTFKLD